LPELPDVTVYLEALEQRIAGATLERVRLLTPFLLRSVDPPLSAVTGIPLDIQTVAANRSSFAVGPITDDIITTQQGVADRFHKLGLIPKPVAVRDIVWRPAQT